MKFIKRHRYTIILLLVFVLLVCLAVKVKEVLMPDEGKATYGQRLKDIDNYPISVEVYNKIDEEYKDNANVLDINHKLQGKVINYYITLKDEVSVKDAKALGNNIVTYFDEETLKYYSLQLFLVKENKTLNNFPIIGMKDPLSSSIVWTKDREIVESDTNEN